MPPPDTCHVCDFSRIDFTTNVKVFHELMARKVREILLVATPYDAFILEEDGSITSKIINEYRGLNLSQPPRITKAATGAEALDFIQTRRFDLVVTMPGVSDMDTRDLVMEIRARRPKLPILLLSHQPYEMAEDDDTCSLIDNQFIWTGNADLLLALIKEVEDRMNVETDTAAGRVRVLILVEDSPLYRSIFLPVIYKVLVRQTCFLMAETLNEEHRLLKMRARPKILVAETFEAALSLFEKFRPYVFAVMTDTRFPKECRLTEDAGAQLLSRIKSEIPHLPLLLMSTESENRQRAAAVQAVFIDKNSPMLEAEIEAFFRNYLGFGDFVFRLPDKSEVGRAATLRQLEQILPGMPEEPILYHARRNHFSNWLMARSEIVLASRFAEFELSHFDGIGELKQFIISGIHTLRRARQRGVVVQFDAEVFDPNVADFVKMGKGSLGGKARGLAFLNAMLHEHPDLHRRFAPVRILVPKTLVIATDGFDSFVAENRLEASRLSDCDDAEIQRRFLEADLPQWLYDQLTAFLRQVAGPLSVRSSSLLEDAHFQSYAGLYQTYMVPNNHPDFFVRLHHLITAVKLVFASTFYAKPRAFSERISQQFREDRMAVVLQQLAGSRWGDAFFPAFSGVAQSHNFYPVGKMKAADGICRIGFGFGAILDEPEQALRFCPAYPQLLPQFSTVEDILTNAQRRFYALRLEGLSDGADLGTGICLEKREIAEAEDLYPVRRLASTYLPAENRIRDTGYMEGPKVMTFASVLKHQSFPLADLVAELLRMGRKGLGGEAEIEFAVDLSPEKGVPDTFYCLQIRPLSAGEGREDVQVSDSDVARAFCFSAHALGHGRRSDMADIVYVKPRAFEPSRTRDIAAEIGAVNGALASRERPFLLVGPGRWGSADHWLGIPVSWNQISGVGAMVELRDGQIHADASQGSHFFQKITGRGIHYLTLNPGGADFLDWEWLEGMNAVQETAFLRHVRLSAAFLLKNDGKSSRCVLLPPTPVAP